MTPFNFLPTEASLFSLACGRAPCQQKSPTHVHRAFVHEVPVPFGGVTKTIPKNLPSIESGKSLSHISEKDRGCFQI